MPPSAIGGNVLSSRSGEIGRYVPTVRSRWPTVRASCTIVLAAGLAACGDSTPTPPEPRNQAPVAVGSIPAMELARGDTLTLNVAQYFSDPDGDALTYSASVSDAGVARATLAGTVVTLRAHGEGSATLTVTASDGNLSASQEAGLTVLPNRPPVAVDGIPAVDFVNGGLVSLNAASYFSDPDGDALTYAASVSDSAVATVSVADSVVTIRARAEGSATVTITASDGSLSASHTAALTVLPRSVEKVTVSPDRPRVFGQGEEAQFTAVVRDTSGVALPAAPVAWWSSAPAVATVSTEGVVAAVAEGAATIKATSDQVSDSVRIAVGPPAIQREYEALRMMYEQLGGSSWKESTNWGTDQALDTWSGVKIDSTGFVTELRLDGNNLAGTLPAEIGAFRRLERLDLDLNFGITGEIPPEIGDMESVDWLKFSSTSLSGPVPAEIGGLSKLTILELHNTELTALPPEIGNLSELMVLRGYQSKFTGPLPPEIGNLKKLRSLELHRNGFSGTIPAEVGSMTSLDRLDLHNNDLTGSIPPSLGHAANLTALRLSNNRLGGELPEELGRAVKLRSLALDGNGLSGPLPAAFGDLVSLETMRVQNNDLSGSIPPEYGNLKQLQEMSASNNRRLSGPLPAELTQLEALRRLLLGRTRLCAPTNPQFLAWLRGVRNTVVRRCTTALGSDAYLTQAVQSREYPVPLIAGDSALLRVFVVSEQAAAAGVAIPSARATFYMGDSEVFAIDLPGTSTPVPDSLDESDLDLSLNAVIPGSVLQPGPGIVRSELDMVVEIDPENTLDPALEVATRIPEMGRMPLDVRVMPFFDLTVIPLLWRGGPDSAAVQHAASMAADPANHEMLWHARNLLPVGELGVTAHEPVWSSANDAQTLFRELEAIYRIEGAANYYMGMISGRISGRSAGLARPGGKVSFVIDDPEVIGHELGHNFGFGHTPCVNSRGDPNYPNPNGFIASWGYDFREGGSLLSPYGYYDLMSYCHPKWIGEYTFSRMAAFRHAVAGGQAQYDAAATGPSLLLWGGAKADGQPFLEPVFVVDAPPQLPQSIGANRLTGRSPDGVELFAFSFDMLETADGDGSSSFAFTLPVQHHWADQLETVTVAGPRGSFTLEGNNEPPVALMLDRRTGEVRGFLRDQPSEALARAHMVELGARTDLEVLFSRGIPAAPAWRR